MRKRETFFFTFFLFFFIGLGLFILDKTVSLNGPRGFFERITRPIQGFAYTMLRFPTSIGQDSRLQKLQDENTILRKRLVNQEQLIKENSALQDQFQTTFPKSTTLLAATIIGSPKPTYCIIDKGQKDGVIKGQAVVVKDTVVGKITTVSASMSIITFITATTFSLTAVTSPHTAFGVIKGQGQDLVLDNVILAEKLEVGDTILTKGDIDTNGLGFLPNLIIGKITSVEKKPSALFQSAKVKSSLDFGKLTTVFVVTGTQE